MADFLKAYQKTAKNEGGYTCHPSDNGNWTGAKVGTGYLIGTNYGVSAPLLCQYLGKTATVSEMKNLDKNKVPDIFRKLYWNVINGDLIHNQEIAEELFDDAILSGPASAIRKMQTTVGAPVTGILDSLTLNKINGQ